MSVKRVTCKMSAMQAFVQARASRHPECTRDMTGRQHEGAQAGQQRTRRAFPNDLGRAIRLPGSTEDAPNTSGLRHLPVRICACRSPSKGITMNSTFTPTYTVSLLEAVSTNGSFRTFYKALGVAGLTHMLIGKGPYTLFAPTDKAFGKLPEDKLEDLFRSHGKNRLITILEYHIFPGRASRADVRSMHQPKMVQGQCTRIARDGNSFTIDEAHTVGEEIASSNGVIHAIDTVIEPSKIR
jgi:uncharacterized surface protein with fasciclin (FAS1) repeats